MPAFSFGVVLPLAFVYGSGGVPAVCNTEGECQHSPTRAAVDACYYTEGLTAQEIVEIINRTGLRPPTQPDPFNDFISSETVWVGDADLGPSRNGERVRLTYSFPDDTAIWESPGFPFSGPNDLNATLQEVFGQRNLDLGREFIRQGISVWAFYGGVELREVADNNSQLDQDPVSTPKRGDIRIGGTEASFEVLATNSFPLYGGDMAINTLHFDESISGVAFLDDTGSFRTLRHTVAHEHGHGLGFFHTVPCTGNKTMEPIIPPGGIEPLRVDEQRGAGSNYGDRFSGNSSIEAAVQLDALDRNILSQQLVTPAVVERHLSTNGPEGLTGAASDWFRFEVKQRRVVEISVTPTGGIYTAGAQQFGCSIVPCGDAPSGAQVGDCFIFAETAGDLAFELIAPDGTVTLQSSADRGMPEALTVELEPGAYHLRVFDSEPLTHVSARLQLYDLALRLDGSVAPPRAFAGIDKRIRAKRNCFFIGDILSTAQEPGATIVRYDWDLDGDGAFETKNTPRPVVRYQSAGEVNVTLRVTDSSGLRDTHSIQVTVVNGLSTSGTPELLPALLSSAAADVNSDGAVDAKDIASIVQLFGVNESVSADLTNDGRVDSADLALALQELLEEQP